MDSSGHTWSPGPTQGTLTPRHSSEEGWEGWLGRGHPHCTKWLRPH